MKNFRRELVSVVTVLLLTVAIVFAFPRGSFSYRHRPAAPTKRVSSAAFITLTRAQEEEALNRAKSTWHFSDSAAQSLPLRLPLGELPEEEAGPLLPEIPMPPQEVTHETLPAPLPAWVLSERADTLKPFTVEVPEKAALVFPREELLKLNSND